MFSLRLIDSVMFGATFNPGYTCWTNIILGTINSLSINNLASNNSLCHRNGFQNSVHVFKKWLNIFCQEAQNCVYFLLYDFVQFSPACVPNTCQCLRRF